MLGFSVSNLLQWHEAWRIKRRADVGVFRLSDVYGVQLREPFACRLRVVVPAHSTVLRQIALVL